MFSKKILVFITILLFALTPVITLAAYGLEETAGAAKLTTTAPGELPALIGSILGTGLSLVGILFFALMLYGGLTWMLARGNAEQEKQALNTITAAIIGIVIVLASYAITNFVFKSIGLGGGGSTVATKKCQLNTASLNSYCGDVENCVEEEGLLPTQVCNEKDDICVGDSTKTGVIGEICKAMDQEECVSEPANYICKWGK